MTDWKESATMTDEPEDIAEFQLMVIDENGDEEFMAGSSGPRETALTEILSFFRGATDLGERRVYEVIRIRVDLSSLDAPGTSGLIITLPERRQ